MSMRQVIAVVVTGLSVVAAAGGAVAGGLSEAAELESARANARAGGPVSERDAELLQRWGCLSGTDNQFCRRLEHRERHHSRQVYPR
jgi:hypothetical protein